MKSLFASQTAYEILELLTHSPKEQFGLADITKKLQKDKANITRELDKLIEEGLVTEHKEENKKNYSFNEDYTGAKELSAFLLKRKEGGIVEKFNKKWVLAEDVLNMDPFFSQIWMNCFATDFAKASGRAYRWVAAIYKDYHLWFYYEKQDAVDVAENLVNRFIKTPAFMHEVNEQIVAHSDKLIEFSKNLPEEGLGKLSAEKLWNFTEKHIDLHSQYYEWGWIPPASDMVTDTLTEKGKSILREYGVKEEEINDTLSLLTTPTQPSLIKIEQDSLRSIAIKIQKDKDQLAVFEELFRKFKEEDVKEFGLYTHTPAYEAQFEKRVRDLVGRIRPDILDAVQKHYEAYFYTKFLFTEEQGVYNFEHYLKELVRVVNRVPDLEAEVKKEDAELKEAVAKINQTVKKLKLDEKSATFFKEWGGFMVTKIYRRYAQLFALYKISIILGEVGARLGLSIKQVKFMAFDEIKAALLKNKKVSVSELNERIKTAVYYTETGKKGVLISGPDAKRAEEFIVGVKEDLAGMKELKGQTGCSGFAVGTVRIVNVIEDMDKVKDGDILVSVSTQPDLLPAMKRSAAFVTEQGGVTSHAAIVAREMKKPCVIGTKIATRVLKDGMKVEVDATKGMVRIVG